MANGLPPVPAGERTELEEKILPISASEIVDFRIRGEANDLLRLNQESASDAGSAWVAARADIIAEKMAVIKSEAELADLVQTLMDEAETELVPIIISESRKADQYGQIVGISTIMLAE